MKTTSRILELDALRGLAAVAVVLFHYFIKYNQEYTNSSNIIDPLVYGQYGVHLFFMISGYVIFMTVDKTDSWLKFARLRFSRLFPTYWSAIIITFIIVSIFGLAGREISWKAFLFNFSMLQELFTIPHVDGAYWSLLPELMFYILMGVLIRFNLVKHIRLVNVLWLGLILVNQFIEIPELIRQIFNLKCGALFIVGVQFYLIKHHTRHWDVIILIGAYLLSYFTVPNHIAFAIITSFFLIFIGFHFGLLKFLKFKPLLYLGAISYPLYLVHQNIGYVVMNLLEIPVWLETTLVIILSLGLSSLIHFFIEKPSLQYLRNRFKTK